MGEIVHEQSEGVAEIIDVEFTVNMETLLDKIAEGDITWRKVIDGFFSELNKMLNVLKRWKRLKSKMSQPVKTVKFVVLLWL
ncbi:hypothetical protein ACVQ9Z_07965 [Staphylococcus aureus]